MFINKALLRSLSLSMFFTIGNWSGAIAQNIQKSERYLSDQEIQSFESELQAGVRGGSRFFMERRTLSEVNQINDFVKAWQQVDPSISPFLGAWSGWEEGLSIYPSEIKGQVCVVATFNGGREYGIINNISIGRVLDNKLLLEGEGGKLVIVKKSGVLKSGDTINFIAEFGSYGGRKGISSYVFPKRLPEIIDNRLFKLRCTTSFPSLSNSIPSVPLSSTPVKQIDAIAKYPTNDDFNAFEDKLQGNPESLVKLRGNQAEQRRKFQNDWQDRNPNAAKFLGAWYTGNRYFYVFPSTAKSRTCVVTQDANGNLDMQIGTVLNQELRYGGGKGFFWRDRSNIIASRDSGSGSLYPIYATSAIPELPESIIGDMERQKCITALPFEADAQYYKERGNKFAKLGKKDEAVANYRRAIELYRKQNQLAQIRSLESLIAGLSGTSANKPTTPKPLDTAYSLPSPLYEDVNDPNYGSEAFKNRKDITPTFRVGLNAFDVVDNGQTVRLNSKVNSSAPTIIITHGWKNDLTSAEFRNLLKAIRYNSSMQVLVTDWSQASKTDITELGLAASRIEVSASKVVDLIQKYKLNPNNVHLIGHSLGAHLSVEIALELQKRSLGGVKSITLLDPAVDLPTGYQVKALSDVSPTTFIRAFYASLGGDSKFAASANESYNIKFPFGPRRPDYSHGEAMTLLANSFQGNSNGDRNCIAERFIKLDERFPNMPQNDTRQLGDGNSLTDLLVGYDKNNWLYPKKIIRGKDYVEPEKGKCILDSNLYAQ